jgi:anti-sigma factor RsiW
MFGLGSRRHVTGWLAAYAEGLLPTARAAAVATHVLRCPRCRRSLEQVRAGQQHLTRLAPAGAGAPSWAELAPLLDDLPSFRPSPFRWAFAAAAAALVVAGGLAWRGPRPHAAGAALSLEAAALEVHRSGALALRSTEAAVVERWLADQGADLRLPPSTDHRRLEGATRLPGGALALAYRLDEQPVTLVFTNAPGGGPKTIARRGDGTLQVASWNQGNRAYALVSGLRTPACTVCHASEGGAALL